MFTVSNEPTVNKGDSMKIVIQRVKEASVSIDGKIAGAITQGLLLLVGVGPDDQAEDISYAVRKISNMRIFSDANDKMNLSIKDIKGSILSVSQFTLYADTKKGNRPAFTGAAKPEMASQFYDSFNEQLAQLVPVERGVFGADMQVSLINDGPVTIILDTHNRWAVSKWRVRSLLTWEEGDDSSSDKKDEVWGVFA